jgi:hypothetical protein
MTGVGGLFRGINKNDYLNKMFVKSHPSTYNKFQLTKFNVANSMQNLGWQWNRRQGLTARIEPRVYGVVIGSYIESP